MTGAIRRKSMDLRSARASNPPIPGHALLFEGQVYWRLNPYSSERQPVGGCECGAKPDGFPDVSANAMKRWHRQHKAQLRGDA